MSQIFVKIITYSSLVQPKLFGLIPFGSAYQRKEILGVDIMVRGVSQVLLLNKNCDLSKAYKDKKGSQVLRSMFYDYNRRYVLENPREFSLRNMAAIYDEHPLTVPLSEISSTIAQLTNKDKVFVSYDCDGDEELIGTLIGSGVVTVIDAFAIANQHLENATLEFNSTNAANIMHFWDNVAAKLFESRYGLNMDQVFQKIVVGVHRSKQELIRRIEENSDITYESSLNGNLGEKKVVIKGPYMAYLLHKFLGEDEFTCGENAVDVMERTFGCNDNGVELFEKKQSNECAKRIIQEILT